MTLPPRLFWIRDTTALQLYAQQLAWAAFRNGGTKIGHETRNRSSRSKRSTASLRSSRSPAGTVQKFKVRFKQHNLVES